MQDSEQPQTISIQHSPQPQSIHIQNSPQPQSIGIQHSPQPQVCRIMAVASGGAREAVAPQPENHHWTIIDAKISIWTFGLFSVRSHMILKNHHQDQVKSWNGFRKWHFRASVQKCLGVHARLSCLPTHKFLPMAMTTPVHQHTVSPQPQSVTYMLQHCICTHATTGHHHESLHTTKVHPYTAYSPQPQSTTYTALYFAHMQPEYIIINHCTQPQSICIQYSPQPQPVYSIMNNHSRSAHSIANNHRLSAYVAISTIQRVHMYQWNNWKSQLGSSNYVLTNATRRMFGAHRHLLKQNCRCCHNWWGAEGNQLSAREETAEEKRMHEEIIGFHL